MFVQHKFIDPNHYVALESCVRTHTVVTPNLLAKLYDAALQSTKAVQLVQGISCSHIKTQDYCVGTATDDKTGIYVQLVALNGKTGNLLTVGSKWAMERNNPQLGNTSVTFW